MQMCNTQVTSSGMPGTAINSAIVNTNSSTAHPAVSTAANGSLVVDSIIKSTSNFALNEDSNGVKDAAKKSARVICRRCLFYLLFFCLERVFY